MNTNFKKVVKTTLDNSPEVFADKVVCKKDGTIEVKRSYFYSHGNTAKKWADKVEKELVANGLNVKVSHRDDWVNWPKTSYFVAIVTEA